MIAKLKMALLLVSISLFFQLNAGKRKHEDSNSSSPTSHGSSEKEIEDLFEGMTLDYITSDAGEWVTENGVVFKTQSPTHHGFKRSPKLTRKKIKENEGVIVQGEGTPDYDIGWLFKESEENK